MKHILTFPVFEAKKKSITPADWAGDWEALPEWQLLRLMGFGIYEIRSNGTVVLSQPYSSVLPRLTSYGYVRTSDQGYVFRTDGPNTMAQMLGYLIERFAKKGIPTIPLPDLDQFMQDHPEMLKVLNDQPKIKQGVLARTEVSDPLKSVYDLYQKHGISWSAAKWLDKSTNGEWTLNETTGLVDIQGSFYCPTGNKLGFRGVKFGVVSGNFKAETIGLTSLAGSPRKVGGEFSVASNKDLESLLGGPEEVGKLFDIRNCAIKSLEGSPKKVEGSFLCDGNKLTDLKGAPNKTIGNFSCDSNNLTSLEGSPRVVTKNFDCSRNLLKTLVGGPEKVGENYVCSHNKLITLEGLPTDLELLDCQGNQLTSLKGAPKYVKGNFSCSFNNLTTLEGAPEKIGGSFVCVNNKISSLVGAPKIVGWNLNCEHNPLVRLNGAPLKVKKGFYCSAFKVEGWDEGGFLQRMLDLLSFCSLDSKKDSDPYSPTQVNDPIEAFVLISSTLVNAKDPRKREAQIREIFDQIQSSPDRLALISLVKKNLPEIWDVMKGFGKAGLSAEAGDLYF